MKNLFVAFVAFTILFLTGCRENSFNPVTGPVVKDQLVDTPPQSGIIPLTGDLAIPGPGHISWSIKGEIKYTYRFLAGEWDSPDKFSNITLQMFVNAVFLGNITGDSPDTYVTEKTEDVIYVSEDGIYVMEKAFPVRGSTPGLNLVCRFLVTTDGVSLDNMRLTTFDDVK